MPFLTVDEEAAMLVMSKKGILYDIPEKELARYAFPRWNDKKKEVVAMLKSLSKVVREAQAGGSVEVEAQGCCNIHPNWCPNV